MANRGAGLVVGSIPTRGNEIFKIDISVSSLWCQGKERR